MDFTRLSLIAFQQSRFRIILLGIFFLLLTET